MEENIIQSAIQSALECQWPKAIKINLLILKDNPDDIDSLNRLARAYYENGEYKKAKKTSEHVLDIDPNNKIAINSLNKYSQNKTTSGVVSNIKTDFIEEPGKTKLTLLLNLGPEEVYSQLNSGDEVLLAPHAHKISVLTCKGEYIGKLADDLSARLRQLIKLGNKYKVTVKSISQGSVKIFIKGDCISFPRESSESISEFSS